MGWPLLAEQRTRGRGHDPARLATPRVRGRRLGGEAALASTRAISPSLRTLDNEVRGRARGSQGLLLFAAARRGGLTTHSGLRAAATHPASSAHRGRAAPAQTCSARFPGAGAPSSKRVGQRSPPALAPLRPGGVTGCALGEAGAAMLDWGRCCPDRKVP